MPRTILDAFRVFSSNLEITDLQQSTVSVRQQNVRNAMEAGLNVIDTFLTGSYSRHTMITPLSDADIDIFVILNSSYFQNYNGQNGGQAGLLDLVKRVLTRTYTKTPDISRSGQAVSIRFTDFVVDVVPGFNRQGGGYLIPNSITQTWLATNPKKHVEICSNANQAHKGNLVPLIKMLKAWNRVTNNQLRSFHLETMIQQILHGVQISDYSSASRYFFDKARSYVTQNNPDPAGFGDDVGGYLNTTEKVQSAVDRFQTAYTRALTAEDFARQGNISDSMGRWRMIFGDYFPGYG